MSRKVSAEAKVAEYFANAPLQEAQVTFNIVKQVIFNRQYAAGKPKKEITKRKARQQAAKGTLADHNAQRSEAVAQARANMD